MSEETTEKAPNPRNIRPAQPTGRPRKEALTKPDGMDSAGLGRVVVLY